MQIRIHSDKTLLLERTIEGDCWDQIRVCLNLATYLEPTLNVSLWDEKTQQQAWPPNRPPTHSPNPKPENDLLLTIISAIADSDVVILRNCFKGGWCKTYHRDRDQDLAGPLDDNPQNIEAIEGVNFSDQEYGEQTVSLTELRNATISGNEIILEPNEDFKARSIFCYLWHPEPIVGMPADPH